MEVSNVSPERTTEQEPQRQAIASQDGDAPTGDAPLRVQIRRVHEGRGGYQVLAQALAEKQRIFADENANLVTLVEQAKATVAAAEAALRQLTLEAFARTGERQPGPGVAIRLVKRVRYEFAAAFAWAKVNGMALTLDAKAFEKIAIATPLPCADVEEVPQATIATDLGTALAEAV